jgi:hypothetical protein
MFGWIYFFSSLAVFNRGCTVYNKPFKNGDKRGNVVKGTSYEEK